MKHFGAILLLLTLIIGSVTFLKITDYLQVQATFDRVCFCHNVDHNPHTICTSNQGLIHGHNNHVEKGKDTLGVCGLQVTVTPTEILVEPSVTPDQERESTPSATPIPPGESSPIWIPPEYKPPVCSVSLPNKPSIQSIVRTSPDTVEVSWNENNGDQCVVLSDRVDPPCL